MKFRNCLLSKVITLSLALSFAALGLCVAGPANAAIPPAAQVGKISMTPVSPVAVSTFISDHPHIAGTLAQNPSIVNSRQLLAEHPAIAFYLDGQPHLMDALRNNPNLLSGQVSIAR